MPNTREFLINGISIVGGEFTLDSLLLLLLFTPAEEMHCNIHGLKCLNDNYEDLTVVIPHWSRGRRKGVVCEDCLPSCTELDVSVVHDSIEKWEWVNKLNSITSSLSLPQNPLRSRSAHFPSGDRHNRTAHRTLQTKCCPRSPGFGWWVTGWWSKSIAVSILNILIWLIIIIAHWSETKIIQHLNCTLMMAIPRDHHHLHLPLLLGNCQILKLTGGWIICGIYRYLINSAVYWLLLHIDHHLLMPWLLTK